VQHARYLSASTGGKSLQGVTTQPLRRGSSSLQLAASPYGTRARSGTPLSTHSQLS
jgi:hypothetical protein